MHKRRLVFARAYTLGPDRYDICVELAEPFGMSLTGLKKHVRVLEEAGLVTTEKVGRARRCTLTPRRLDEVDAWVQMYRRMLDERLDRFGELLERTAPQPEGDPR